MQLRAARAGGTLRAPLHRRTDMMPTEYDHLFAGGLIPLSAMLAAGSAPKQADSAQRRGFYRQAWLTGAAMVGLSLLVWAASGRPLQAFGLVGWSGDRPVATAAAAGLILGGALLVIWMHATYNVASFTIGKLVLANGSAAPDIGSAARQEAG